VDRYTLGEHPPTPEACQELGLTERQAQVLVRIAQGKPNKIICRELNLAVGTVKIHVSAVLKALKVSNRTQAAIAARTIERGRTAFAPGMKFEPASNPGCVRPEDTG
jgi:DNA-binding NarL/FixJ family response regulator